MFQKKQEDFQLEGPFTVGYSFKGPYKENWEKIKIIRSPLVPRGKHKSFQLAINFFSFFFLAPFLVRGKFDKIFVYEPSPITVAIPAIIEEWKADLTAPATHSKILAAQIKKMSEMSKIDLKEMGDNALACYLFEFERNKLITELEVELAALV